MLCALQRTVVSCDLKIIGKGKLECLPVSRVRLCWTHRKWPRGDSFCFYLAVTYNWNAHKRLFNQVPTSVPTPSGFCPNNVGFTVNPDSFHVAQSKFPQPALFYLMGIPFALSFIKPGKCRNFRQALSMHFLRCCNNLPFAVVVEDPEGG